MIRLLIYQTRVIKKITAQGTNYLKIVVGMPPNDFYTYTECVTKGSYVITFSRENLENIKKSGILHLCLYGIQEKNENEFTFNNNTEMKIIQYFYVILRYNF